TGNLFFTTQQAINNFATNYPSCTTVKKITIKGDDITDLSGLSNITQINGTLHIYENPALESLSGLENLTTIISTLWINDNALLQDLDELAGVETVGNVFNVSSNPNLTSISGLSGLISIGSNFDVRYNDMLPSLAGLEQLESVGGNLTIGGAALSSITALNNLTSVTGEIFISNTALSSLSGIGHINPSGITNVDIQRSSGLTQCEVASICAYISNPANPAVFNLNGVGCSTRLEVTYACEALPVELADFGYHLADGIVVLNWLTVSELNNLGFEVEYAKDGLHWQQIGFVEGYGTTTDIHHYEFPHYGSSEGTNYYRLKQLDYDGKYEYSNILSVSLNSQWEQGAWILYPNPTKGELTVNGDLSDLPFVRIMNNSGVLIREFALSEPRVDISDLPEGMYIFTFNNGREIVTRRILKDRR
ncbi:MAG: T9SS type A sorting domain-containing protein, partial [Lewinella sp.]|nr:T9SS type A sorting domain-containing protein [Lewinella sp.]